MAKPKLWTKDFIMITIMSLSTFLAFYVLLTALPLYIADEFQAGAEYAGLLVTLFLLAAIVIRPFAGKWASQGSKKKILIYSSIAFFVATLLYPFASSLWSLLLLRIVHGITFGMMTTIQGTISTDLIPDSRRGEGLSYFSLGMGAAMVVGPVIGLNLGNIDAYQAAFILCMVISAVSILLSMIVSIPEKARASSNLKENKRFSFNDIMDKKAAPFALTIFLLAFAYSGISSFLSLYAIEIDQVQASSTFFILYAIFMIICRPFTGRWADMYGAKWIVYACILLFGIGMFLLQSSQLGIIIMLAGIIIGMGYGSVVPLLQTQVINSVEKHRSGMAYSLFFNAMDLGMAVGAFVLGMIADSFGYRNIFITGLALIIVGGLEYALLGSRKKTEEATVEARSVS